MITQLITGEMTVNEAIHSRPEALTLFHTVGIDTCCGGQRTIAEAAGLAGLDSADLLANVNSPPTEPNATAGGT